LKTTSETDLQKGYANPPPWDGSFDVLDALVNDLLSQYVKNTSNVENSNGSSKKKMIIVTMIMIMVENE